MAGEGDAPDAADRSEAATPRRLEQARERGQVALSREAAGFAALLVASLACFVVLPPLGGELLMAMRVLLQRTHDIGMADAVSLLGGLALLLVLPIAGGAAAGALGATLVQTRGLVAWAPLAPRFDKVSPLAGLKRLFGVEGLVELLRSLAKLALVGVALWFAIDDPMRWQALFHAPPGATLRAAMDASVRLMTAALIAFGGVAVLDLVWVHLRHLHTLRMSRQELREEAKESEGDPHFRARRRQIRESRARVRMMAAVPKAAVVITNPTHYAVALAYAGGDAAPKLVAKGVDEVAARIRESAEAAGVPLVANPPLARALHRLEIGAEIPAEHYQAVAGIIAFVWKRRGRT